MVIINLIKIQFGRSIKHLKSYKPNIPSGPPFWTLLYIINRCKSYWQWLWVPVSCRMLLIGQESLCCCFVFSAVEWRFRVCVWHVSSCPFHVFVCSGFEVSFQIYMSAFLHWKLIFKFRPLCKKSSNVWLLVWCFWGVNHLSYSTVSVPWFSVLACLSNCSGDDGLNEAQP